MELPSSSYIMKIFIMIKNLYYYLLLILVTKFWVRIAVEIIIYLGLLYIIVKMFGGASGTASAVSPEVAEYKDLLEDYTHQVPVSEMKLNLKASLSFVKQQFPASLWCTDPNTYTEPTTIINTYITKRLVMFAHLTLVEKGIALNHLTTILTYQHCLIENNWWNDSLIEINFNNRHKVLTNYTEKVAAIIKDRDHTATQTTTVNNTNFSFIVIVGSSILFTVAVSIQIFIK